MVITDRGFEGVLLSPRRRRWWNARLRDNSGLSRGMRYRFAGLQDDCGGCSL